MEPYTKCQRTECETTVVVTTRQAETGSESHSSHLLILTNLGGRILSEKLKVNFILIDVIAKVPRLLIDNHAPFGFHVHEDLPSNKESRRQIPVNDYSEIMEEFWRLAKEIINGDL